MDIFDFYSVIKTIIFLQNNILLATDNTKGYNLKRNANEKMTATTAVPELNRFLLNIYLCNKNPCVCFQPLNVNSFVIIWQIIWIQCRFIYIEEEKYNEETRKSSRLFLKAEFNFIFSNFQVASLSFLSFPLFSLRYKIYRRGEFY